MGGLKDKVGEQDLREYFGKYGTIETVDVITDKATGAMRGFCFITYDDYDSVDRACREYTYYINLAELNILFHHCST